MDDKANADLDKSLKNLSKFESKNPWIKHYMMTNMDFRKVKTSEALRKIIIKGKEYDDSVKETADKIKKFGKDMSYFVYIDGAPSLLYTFAKNEDDTNVYILSSVSPDIWKYYIEAYIEIEDKSCMGPGLLYFRDLKIIPKL